MMSEITDRMQRLKDSQGKLLKEYESLVHELESHDYLKENEQLRLQIESTGKQLEQLKKDYERKLEENQKLRFSLAEQIMDERLSILRQSKQKLDTYFKDAAERGVNRLQAWERQSVQEVDRMLHSTGLRLSEDKAVLQERIQMLSHDLQESVRRHRERMEEEERRLQARIDDGYQRLAEEEVSEEVIQRRLKQNQVEMKIGLNWMNKIGILLILFGVGAAFKYSYSTWFNSYMKGSAFFLLGALMLLGGEFLYRREKKTFALGLLGGGISVLYGSIFYSYFLLDIIDLTVGLSLSVGVTVLAVLLSLRYQSRTVCSLGLVGGYLPLFSYMGAFGLEGPAVYAAMGYLLLLNLFILIISFHKKWTVVHYISFLFNIPSMLALIYLAPSELVSMGYSIATFLMYLGITLGYAIKHKVKLLKLDVAMLAMNTLVSCGVLYLLFDELHWEDYNGLLALVFCLVYVALGQFVEKVMKEEKQTTLLFYATSLTFAVLMIPFQFGAEWLSLGWLIEGVILMIYGHMSRMKSIEKAGWGIFALCLGAFLLWDVYVMSGLLRENSFFALKYSFVTAGLLLTTLYYMMRDPKAYIWKPYDNSLLILKYTALANVWIYLLYMAHDLYDRWVPAQLYHNSFYKGLLVAFITILLAYGLPKVTIWTDRVVRYYSYFLYGAGYLLCLHVTLTMPALRPEWQQNTALEYIALGLLAAFNLFILGSGRDLLIAILRRQHKSMELYPMILGVYLLGILTAFLIVQFQLGRIGLLFSLVYLTLAIVYIVYGFRQRYVNIRRLGLGLTLISTGKLILYDLAFLSAGSKIFAYFCFGVVLLAVSYMYQKVSSRLEGQHANKNESI
jgi:uncharacterized membrane protein